MSTFAESEGETDGLEGGGGFISIICQGPRPVAQDSCGCRWGFTVLHAVPPGKSLAVVSSPPRRVDDWLDWWGFFHGAKKGQMTSPIPFTKHCSDNKFKLWAFGFDSLFKRCKSCFKVRSLLYGLSNRLLCVCFVD